MIPFVTQPMLHLGPLAISAFGVIVAAAVALGLSLGRARFDACGLDRETGAQIATWMLIGGFAGAHMFSVMFYFPRQLVDDPLLLVRFWDNVSSMGGMLGGLLALYIVLRRNTALTSAQQWVVLGAVAYVFPFALFVGRIACSLAHDHPGIVTTFPLAVSLETEAAQAFIRSVYLAAGTPLQLAHPVPVGVGFHDLGIYECMYLGIIVVPLMWWLGRRDPAPEMFVAAFIALYMPARFLLDFLRVADARYIGLTPAQWISLIAIATLPFLIAHARTGLQTSAQLNNTSDGEPS